MQILLEPIPIAELRELAAARIPDRIAGEALAGALPPALVAARSLAQLGQGKPAHWCSTFYIREPGGRIVGGCGFKDVPTAGIVEIGYAISPQRRRCGAATAAVTALIALATDSAEARQLLARVVESNLASAGVLAKLGFQPSGIEIEAGERLQQWRLPLAP